MFYKRSRNRDPLFVGQIARQLAYIECSGCRNKLKCFACEGIDRQMDEAVFVNERYPPCVLRNNQVSHFVVDQTTSERDTCRVQPALRKLLTENFPIPRTKRLKCRWTRLAIRRQFRCVTGAVMNEAAEVQITKNAVLVGEKYELMPNSVYPRRIHLPRNMTIQLREHKVPFHLGEEHSAFSCAVDNVILQEFFDEEGRLEVERGAKLAQLIGRRRRRRICLDVHGQDGHMLVQHAHLGWGGPD